MKFTDKLKAWGEWFADHPLAMGLAIGVVLGLIVSAIL